MFGKPTMLRFLLLLSKSSTFSLRPNLISSRRGLGSALSTDLTYFSVTGPNNPGPVDVRTVEVGVSSPLALGADHIGGTPATRSCTGFPSQSVAPGKPRYEIFCHGYRSKGGRPGFPVCMSHGPRREPWSFVVSIPEGCTVHMLRADNFSQITRGPLNSNSGKRWTRDSKLGTLMGLDKRYKMLSTKLCWGARCNNRSSSALLLYAHCCVWSVLSPI